MDKLRRQVQRAQRRLILEQFLSRLVWCLFAAFAVAAVAIAVPKVFVVNGLPANWSAIWLGSAAGAGVLAAAVWTWLVRRNELDAAIEIDLRFNLKERVSSSLSLAPADVDSEAGRALVSDAMRRIERVEVGEKFRVGLDRRGWLPLVPAVLAFTLVLFVEDRTAKSSAQTKVDPQVQKVVKNTTNQVLKKLEEKKKEAEEKGLKDAENLFKKLEKSAEDLEKKSDVDRKKALVKLNDLAKELADRKRQIGGEDGLQKQFEKLNNLSKGPAENLNDALKNGDLKKAMEELEKLQEQIKAGNLDEEAVKKLQEQLKQMKEQLSQAAQNHQQAMEELQNKLDEQRKAGNTAAAAKLQEQLDKLMQNQPQMNALQKMAQQLGQCQQCMQQGDQQGAAQAMQQLAQQLGQMQQDLDEMQMLDAMMMQISDAKGSMNCANCNGQGCAMCQGMGQMSNQFSQNPGGMGLGAGRGRGPRPEEENNVNFRDSQVRASPGRGRAVIKGEIDGPNIKGAVLEAIKEEMTAAEAQEADPLVNQRLPRSHREHAEEYFNALRNQ